MKLEASLPPAALAAIKAPFQNAGADLLDAPTVQPLGQLLDLAGEALRERLFVLQADGGEESCLRPDFTLPAVRAHVASGRATGRYYYEGHAFRVAPAGAGRAEEFLQIGLEAFEDGDVAAQDAEIAAIAWRSACAGGRADLTLLLGDVGLFSAFLESLDVPVPLRARLEASFSSPRRLRAELAAANKTPTAKPGDRLARLLTDASEADAAAALEEIWRLSGIEAVGGRSAAEIVHRLRERATAAAAPHLNRENAALIGQFLEVRDDPHTALRAISRLAGPNANTLRRELDVWARRMSLLHAAGVPAAAMTVSASFGRAFGYYDGALFEIRSRSLGDDEPVAAGGRYDGLPRRLGLAMGAGAVGCMVRPGRAWRGAAP